MNSEVRVGVKSQRKLVSLSLDIRLDQRDYVRGHREVFPNFSAFCRDCVEAAMRTGKTEFPAPKHGARVVRSAYVFADQARWIRQNKINRSALVQAELDSAINHHRQDQEQENSIGDQSSVRHGRR